MAFFVALGAATMVASMTVSAFQQQTLRLVIPRKKAVAKSGILS